MTRRSVYLGLVVALAAIAVAAFLYFRAPPPTKDVFIVDNIRNAATRPATRRARTKPAERGYTQVYFPGMKLIEQPAGYSNFEFAPSPDGRYEAFYCDTGTTGKVIVLDTQTRTQTILPAPHERLMDYRSVRLLQWAGPDHTLYVCEDATKGMRSTTQFADLDVKAMNAEMQKEYEVVYTWQPETHQLTIVDHIPGTYMVSSGAKGDTVRIVYNAGTTDGHFEYRDYRGGNLIAHQIFHVTYQGQNLVFKEAQWLPGHDELWFRALVGQPPEVRGWLAVKSLADPQAPVRLVLPDIAGCHWLPDQNQMYFVRGDKNYTLLNFYLANRDALDKPRLLYSTRDNDYTFHPYLLCTNAAGNIFYFRLLAKPHIQSIREARSVGYRIYEWPRP